VRETKWSTIALLKFSPLHLCVCPPVIHNVNSSNPPPFVLGCFVIALSHNPHNALHPFVRPLHVSLSPCHLLPTHLVPVLFHPILT
jgi:hypothetical protein